MNRFDRNTKLDNKTQQKRKQFLKKYAVWFIVRKGKNLGNMYD